MKAGDIKQVDQILIRFNRHISRLIKLAGQIEPNNLDIDRIKRLINIIRESNPIMLLEGCKDTIWDHSDKIIKKDLNFFISNLDSLNSKYINKKSDNAWLEDIVKLMADRLSVISQDQKKYIWDCLNGMLQDIIEYRILIGDFNNS